MKILLVQTSFLGDTILSTPVISGIKKLYPDAGLWMMTTPLSSSLVMRDPLLSGVITYDKRQRDSGLFGLLRMKRRIKAMGFDRVYSLHRSLRTSLLLWLSGIPVRIGCADAKLKFLYHQTRRRNPRDHDVLRNLTILSGEQPVKVFDNELRLVAPDTGAVDEEIRKRLPPGGSYAVLVPGSAWETKMWHWQGYHQVAKYLIERGIQVIFLGAPSEQNVCARVANGLDVIDFSGKTSISDMMYIMNQAALVVCNDSMSLHMASAFKVPNVAVFCATSPAFGFSPWKNRALVVEKELVCKPCKSHGSRKCPNGNEACMKELSHLEVIGAIEKLLDGK
ncbi:MAG: glycosyltransferase family 9 protein [Desulfobacterales bacterium]|nr:glycosyltransferase family 9 protein [Desulfobacterales bacterium]